MIANRKPDAASSGPNWPRKQAELFEQRHAELLKIRAELAIYELAEPVDDKVHFEISLRLDDAERLVMTTHAPHPHMLWTKIALFESVLHGNGEHDDRIDNRQIWMFGCIKADLMRHCIGGNS